MSIFNFKENARKKEEARIAAELEAERKRLEELENQRKVEALKTKFSWCISISILVCAFFCLTSLVVAENPGWTIFSTVCFAIVGVSLMPLEKIREFWRILELLTNQKEEEPKKKLFKKKSKPQQNDFKLFRNLLFFIVICFALVGCNAGLGEDFYESTEQTSKLVATELTDDSSTIEEDKVDEKELKAEEKKADNTKPSSVEDKTESKPVKENKAENAADNTQVPIVETSFDISSVPAYSGNPYVVINDNVPYFSDSELTTNSFEKYSSLDSLGRCGVAYASIGKDLMPTTDRGSIGSIKPSGWHTVKYNGVVSGNYLYNRCHLIGYQLTAENANEKNLITGTRYLNVDGMLPFENMAADYIKATGNHVLYRVTPIFVGDTLVASGVLMEAKSVEDSGAGVLFNVYCYNVQPGITIDYLTGASALDGQTVVQENSTKNNSLSSGGGTNATTPVEESSSSQVAETTQPPAPSQETTTGDLVWIPTGGGKKYHSRASCSGMNNPVQVTRDKAVADGFDACKRCN